MYYNENVQLFPDTNIFHFVVNCYIVKILVIDMNELLFFRLKRTTDVMFGGKQVIICGYGEVSQRGITLTTFGENLTKMMKLSIIKLFFYKIHVFKFTTFNDIII